MSNFPARILVDLAAVRANVHRLRRGAPGAEVMAVVKADAYGHGLLPVARAAVQAGAGWLGVAQLNEALRLRADGHTVPILAWLYGPGAALDQALQADIDLSVGAHWALAEVLAAARQTGRTARVHLKVDTGMGRSGLPLPAWQDLLTEALRAQASGAINIVGVWSHLARADELDRSSVQDQIELFDEAVRHAEAGGADIELRHLANSAGMLLEPQTHYDLVRPGLAVYGLNPAPEVRDDPAFDLVPAMRVEADVLLVKDVPAGYGVSYAHTYTTPSQTVLGVIGMGYADGVPRHASNTGPVQVGRRRVQIAGRVCMDQTVLDLGPGADLTEGQIAVLFGSGAGGEPTAQDWADAVGTINYEIVARIGPRIPKTYLNE
ncbi:MAG TPA: alanine racemase [Beutenbergiaceae bacterium]|nr:alanine racemase [Beutenbergiaceae bacterium]